MTKKKNETITTLLKIIFFSNVENIDEMSKIFEDVVEEQF